MNGHTTGGPLARSIGYDPVLDGLRAIAVTMVIVEHSGVHGLSGFHGVTIFFAISGYLITTLLLTERHASGTLDLRRFYWRRLVRLGPALFVVTVATLAWLVGTGVPTGRYWLGALGTVSWTADLVQVLFGNSHVGVHFQWAWSLGVEEQFYLLWPVLLLLARSPTQLVILLAALIPLSWITRACLTTSPAAHDALFFGPVPHLDALALGVLLGLARFGHPVTRRVRIVAAAGGAIGALGLVLLTFRTLNLPGAVHLDPDGFGIAAVFALGLVLWASTTPRGPLARLIGGRPLAFLGRLSYGLYLWNILSVQVFLRLTGVKPADSPLWPLWLAVLLAVCWASYRLVEVPARRAWATPRAASGMLPRPRRT